MSRINGEMGRVGWTPIEYLYQSVSPAQLASLYRAANVMLVTPLRDGMNLVAKEYVAARTDLDGVLVLSEFAGSAHELPEALIVNPYSIDEMAEAFARALTMSAAERRQRMEGAAPDGAREGRAVVGVDVPSRSDRRPCSDHPVAAGSRA